MSWSLSSSLHGSYSVAAVVGLEFEGVAAAVGLLTLGGFFGVKFDGRGRLLDWALLAEAVEGGVVSTGAHSRTKRYEQTQEVTA